MYNSIRYVEISCKYNRLELCSFCGALQNASAKREVSFRNRSYFIIYDADWNMFFISNRDNKKIARISERAFHFFASSAPEIGLDLIYSFMALLNIYPVKAF